MKRIAISVISTALALSGCGSEGLLDGLGERTAARVVGSTSTTFADKVERASLSDETGVINATAVTWYNDNIVDEAVGLPAYTIAQVWERGHEAGRYIQSSRVEISVALPGVAFPSRIPDEVEWVTSQLVYLEDVAALDSGTSAAFGLWESDPYSSDDGRVGVLRIGLDRGDVSLGDVQSEIVTSGLSLIWSDGRYRYELFCRVQLPEETCRSMVDSTLPLRELLATSS